MGTKFGISFLALGRAKSVERKCQNRISWGNSELTGAQWAPSRAILAHVCPKRPNMGQIGPKDIGVDLAFRTDLIKRSALARHLKNASQNAVIYSL